MSTTINKTSVLQRIKEAKKFNTDKQLADFLGITPQGLTTWKSRNSIDYDVVFSKCEQMDYTWLLTGEGDMIKKEPQIQAFSVEIPDTNRIPVLSVAAAAGLGNSNFTVTDQDVASYCHIPMFSDRKIDFIIPVRGDSMLPRYRHGDYVACHKIHGSKFIQWNRIHVLGTRDQGVLLKRLRKSTMPEHVLAVSDNPEYEPFDVPLDEVTGMAIVVGGVVME